MEKFANSATSTLVNILSQSDTTFAVHSATGFPNSGNFRCLIDSELVLVTGVSGTTFTCTRSIESTTAATHAANASVIAVMTAGGLATAIAEGGGEFLQVLTDDQTPTLGGNLDLNGHTIAGATATEIGYLSGVTSAIQSQLDSKANTANLADVAESGAYSDLSGTPSLAAVATAGTYSSLTGKPTLGTAAALDVGTTANKVVQLNGSAALPAIDGSNLTGVIHHVTDEITGAATSIVSSNLTASRVVVSDSSGKVAASSVTSTTLGYLDATSSIQTQINAKAATSSLATVATTGDYGDLTNTPTQATVATTGAYGDLSGKPSLGTAAALNVGTSANQIVQLNSSAKLPAVDGSNLTGFTFISSVASDSTPGLGGDLALNGHKLGTVTATEIGYVHGLTSSLQSQLDSKAATSSLATVATSGSYDDLNDLPTLGTAAVLDAGLANGVATLDNGGKIPSSQIPTAIVEGLEFAGTWNALTNSPTLASATGTKGTMYKVSTTGSTNLDGITQWNAGDCLFFDGSHWQKIDGLASEVISVAGRIGAVTLAYTDVSGLATVAHTGAYSDLTGKPSLATVATSGAYSDLSGTPTLADVATSGDYNDLGNLPSLGTAAALDVGTSAYQIVQLDNSGKLPAVDGSQLTNIAGGGGGISAVVDDTSPQLGGDLDLNGHKLGTVTATEMGYVHGVTSAIQTQIDGKQATITGGATSITSSNLTASKVLVSDSSGKVAASSVTSTTLGYLDATSSIQTQINAKAATSSLATVATSGAYSDLSGTPSLATVATSGAYSDLSGTPTAITGAATSIVSSNLTASKVLVSDGSGKVAASSVTSTTLGYLDATSSIQTQLNALQPTITGGATSITSSNLTASRALVSDGSGKVAVSSVTSTTLGYLDATSSVQTQIDGKQKKETITNDTDGSTITFDLSASSIHFVTLGGNRTFALSNPTTGQRFMVRPLQDSSGSRTITWWSGISWAGGTPPTPTATADKADLFGFLCTGTNTYDGFIMGQNI